jgi:hypothetical protein
MINFKEIQNFLDLVMNSKMDLYLLETLGD